MSIYDFWIDGTGKAHKISEMDTDYIYNCLSQIERMGHTWRMCKVEELSDEDLSKLVQTGTKAWYVVNAQKYVDAFEIELAVREAIE